MGGKQQARRISQRLDADARRDDIGFGAVVDVARPARAERRDRIVSAGDRSVVARCADGQHPRCVTRRGDPAVLRLSLSVPPEIPRSCHDDHACLNGAPGRKRQRVRRIRLVDTGRNGQVDDADVVLHPMLDSVIERGNHVADVPEPFAVEDFEDDQVCGRRNPAARAVRVVATARDDARDVSPVAVVVVRRWLEVDEVGKVHDTIAAEIVVPRRDARVDDGDADASAVKSEILPHPGRADGRRGALHRSAHRTIQADRADA